MPLDGAGKMKTLKRDICRERERERVLDSVESVDGSLATTRSSACVLVRK